MSMQMRTAITEKHNTHQRGARIHRSPTEKYVSTIKFGGLGLEFRVRLWGVVRVWVRVGARVRVWVGLVRG